MKSLWSKHYKIAIPRHRCFVRAFQAKSWLIINGPGLDDRNGTYLLNIIILHKKLSVPVDRVYLLSDVDGADVFCNQGPASVTGTTRTHTWTNTTTTNINFSLQHISPVLTTTSLLVIIWDMRYILSARYYWSWIYVFIIVHETFRSKGSL